MTTQEKIDKFIFDFKVKYANIKDYTPRQLDLMMLDGINKILSEDFDNDDDNYVKKHY